MSANKFFEDANNWFLPASEVKCVTWNPKKDQLYIHPDGSVTIFRNMVGIYGTADTSAPQVQEEGDE